jgi:hypothetical protein
MILTGTGIIRGVGPQSIPKIVVVGHNGDIIYSDDAVTWQGATAPHSSDANYAYSAVTYSPQRRQFVAIIYDGINSTYNINTSNNGKTWIEQVIPTNTTSWNSVAWSPTLRLYAACAGDGIQNNFMTSPDGVNWTDRSQNATVPFYGYIGYSKIIWSVSSSAFIAIGTDGSDSQNSAYSTNGINWIVNTASATKGRGIAEGDSSLGAGKHVKIYRKTSTQNQASSASDVTSTWTGRTASMGGAVYDWSGVAWSPSLALYCGVASSGPLNYGCERVILSTDGINWTGYSTGLTNINIADIAWSASLGKFIAVGDGVSGTVAMMQSSNGTTWSTITTPNGDWDSIVATS